MTDKDKTEELDVFFAAARQQTDTLSEDLTNRMLGDALAVQAQFAPVVQERQARPGLWRQLVSAVGGWPAMGGLVAACATGIWIGVAPPDFVPDPLTLVGQTQSDLNLLDSYEFAAMMTEGQ